MYLILIMSFLIMIILLIILLILNMTSKKMKFDKEKNSPFECGFDPKSSSRMPFSIQFFLIAIIFLIFDVEIVLMLPMIYSSKLVMMKHFMLTLNLFLSILIGGLIHEWKQGALKWLK